jgi:DNA repair photolyase
MFNRSEEMDKITRKSLLYRSKVEYADFCINHVEGCSHGCKYPCYAMLMAKRFGKIKTYADWIKPKLVSNALDILEQEIPKYRDEIGFVHLCFTTDPFMYKYREVANSTLKIIEKLNQNKIKASVLTKGVYPKVLANSQKYGKNNVYGITLVSLSEDFKKRFEPFSAPFEKRISSLKYLHNAGLKTWVSIEPYPTPNLIEQNLDILLRKISFVDTIVFGKLNYNVKSSEFGYNNKFYEDCANTVVSFCNQNKIAHHIKFGTQIKYNKKTETILAK